MGRTIPTVNQVLEHNREQWARFYRALRREDREYLDQLFDGAKYFTAACVYQINSVPSESIFMAMLLHLQKEIQELRFQLGRQSGKSDGTPTGMDTRPVSDSGRNSRLDDRTERQSPLLLG
jgi:hypothetical protein